MATELKRRTSSGGWSPPVPSRDELKMLLESCFAASLEQDEGRKVTFKLCCEESRLLDYTFAEPPALTPKILARLSAAVDSARSYLCVWRQHEHLVVRGIAHLPITYPSSLTIRVIGPGFMVVLFGARVVFTYRRGEIVHFLDYKSLNDAAAAVLPEPAAPSPLFGLVRQALGDIAARVVERGHGGTVLMVSRDANWTERRTVNGFVPTEPAWLLAESVCVDDAQKGAPGTTAGMSPRWRQRFLSAHSYPLQFDVDWLAHLTGADGITVVDESLNLLGFGVFFNTEPDRVLDITIRDPFHAGLDGRSRVSDLGGARHQSAAVTCAALPGSTALVVSQDGTLTAIHSDANGALMVHKHLELTLRG